MPFSTLPGLSPTAPFTTFSNSSVLPNVTTATLAGIPALQNISDPIISASDKVILGLEQCGRSATIAKKDEKPLLPVDYVTVIPGVVTGDEDVLNQHNGIDLVLRLVGAKKPTPESDPPTIAPNFHFTKTC